MIEDLVESGESGGELLGFYCRGHLDKQEFVRLCNQRSGANDPRDPRFVAYNDVVHLYYRTVQCEFEQKGVMEFRVATGPKKGAWPATICESVVDYNRKRSVLLHKEYERGLGRGWQEGVEWAIHHLKYYCVDPRNKKAAEDLNEMYYKEVKLR